VQVREEVVVLALDQEQPVMEILQQVQDLQEQELPLEVDHQSQQEALQEPQAALQEQVLPVMKLLVEALEQVVLVTAQEMELVRAEVLELAQAVGLVEVRERPLLAVVPDLVQLEEQVEVLEPGSVPGKEWV
jgi:hypothetical protein